MTGLLPLLTLLQQVTVGENVHVSRDFAKASHYELLAGASRHNANHRMACSMMIHPEKNKTISVVYTTVDGGKSWRKTLEADEGTLTGDPVCEYGLADTAYFVVLALPDTGKAKMLVYRSHDAGLTWQKPLVMPFIDRENLAVDQTGGKYHGRVYINGTGGARGTAGENFSTITFYRSTDGGRSFDGPALRAAIAPQHIFGMGNTVVLSDGTTATLFGMMKNSGGKRNGPDNPSPALSVIRVATSSDGGEKLDIHRIDEWYLGDLSARFLAVDPGSALFKDRLYAVWDDVRGGRHQILLSYSSDKGKTWSTPISVVDVRPGMDPKEGPDPMMPLVAVNKAGVVGVTWYDRRDHKDNTGWDLRFAASLDGGETFLPSVKVSSAANVFGRNEVWPVAMRASGGGTGAREGAPAPKPGTILSLSGNIDSFFFSQGHTSGFVVDADGVFHPIWNDNRSGIAQLWTAPVTVRAAVVKHGEPELSDLLEVSEKVTLDLKHVTYDRGRNVLTATAQLKNTSKDTIRGPVKVRVISLKSDVGVPEVIGSVNKKTGVGAVLDLSALLSGGTLKPGELSAPRQLSFRLKDLRPLRQGDDVKFNLITANTRVYAASVSPAPKGGK